MHWTYVARPIWSQWPCRHCGSRLAVNTGRRLLAILALIALMLGGMALASRGTDSLVTLGLAFALWLPLFLVLERPRVVQRCGLRCQSCGYDLTGQVVPRCPECGRPLDDRERTILASGAVLATATAARGWSRLGAICVIVLIALFVATLVAVGVTRWGRTTGRGGVRPASSQPAAPATQDVTD
jgi:hypothetical protein